MKRDSRLLCLIKTPKAFVVQPAQKVCNCWLKKWNGRAIVMGLHQYKHLYLKTVVPFRNSCRVLLDFLLLLLKPD